MKRLRWPGRDRRSMVRTVASCRMTLMRLAMGFAVTAFYPHHIHTPCVCQKVSIVDFLAVFPSLPLISGTTEDMSNLYSAPHFSVVNEILCGREAPCAWFDVITYPPGFRVLSEQPETIYDGIDETVCDIQACALRPIGKYVVQIVLCLFRDAVSLHAFEALPASSLLPRDLTSAAKCPSPFRPTQS